jgi:DNA-binding MarR family transcriptional regulator
MDFDPRDFDSRDDDRFDIREPHRHDVEQDDDVADRGSRNRDGDACSLGRGPGDSRQSENSGHTSRDDARWPERDREASERSFDPREPFTRHLDLPRGVEREVVRDRDREYSLRGSETRTLATVGAFRVVSSRDLRDHDDRAADPRSGDLRHLREAGLIETVRLPGYRDQAVVLTKEGRSLLERHRDHDHEHPQTFYAGLARERELEHDLQVYRAYEQAEARLLERGASIERVVLDHELKGDYQRWLHERDKDRDDYDGHPDRTADEIREWAFEHDLPYFDDEVHFPDARIEYEEPDGRWNHEDVEVVTGHYRGAHGASVARSGFSCYHASGIRISGRSGGGRGGGRNGGLAEELWR